MPPDVTFAEIAEVVETGTRGANILLAQGYVLLGILNHAEQRVMVQADGRPQPYVQRYSNYSLGRPAGIPHVDLPQFAPRARREQVPAPEPPPAADAT